MWRREGNLVSYMYYPGHDRTQCGEDWPWDFQIEDDRWYTLHMHVRVNDPGMHPVRLLFYKGHALHFP